MAELGRFARELRARLWQPSVAEEVSEELAGHMEMLEEDLVARGRSRAEARAQAQATFGNSARIGAECRDIGQRRDRERQRARWIAELGQDIRYAARQLRASPRFAVIAIITLAIGLGASTTIFGIANAVLLRPLAFPHPERLVVAYAATPNGEDWPTSESNYLDTRARATRVIELAGWTDRTPSLAGDGDPEQLRGAATTASFFGVLAVRPALGRAFTPAEDTRGGDRHVAVISDALWRRRFGADPAVLDRRILLDGEVHRVIGVMPPAFDFPGRVDVWTPLAPTPDYPRGDRRVMTFGRLTGSATPARAATELSRIARELAAEYPRDNAGWSARVSPLTEYFVPPAMHARLVALLATVGVLLLLACVNVASLLLARAGVRERELVVRAALGAGRWRIVRQLLTESLVLSALGAAAGCVIAILAAPLVRRTGAAAIPRLAEMHVDWRVLSFALVTCVVTGLAFGLAPALRMLRTRREGGSALLRAGARIADGGRVRSALIVSSIALATLLLVCAGLVGGSFVKLMRVELGFTPERVLTAELSLPTSRYDEERSVTFHIALAQQLRAIPGVRAVGAVNIAPFSGGSTGMGWDVAAHATGPVGDYRKAAWRTVTPGFFAALGIPLRRGRFIEEDDRWGNPPVVVINESLARAGWPDASPIGERIALSNGHAYTVVGVIGDTRHLALDSVPAPAFYFSYRQFPWSTMWLTLRTTGDPLNVAAAVRRQVATLDPMLPVAHVQPLTQLVTDVSAEPRLTMLVFAIFASAALALAAVGLYGIVSYTVAQRTRELGLRLALGARPGRIVNDVIARGLRLAAWGIAIGSAAAFVAARGLRAILFETQPTDAGTFVGVAVILLGVAALASAGPARRAARLDPALTLRSE
jgi:putative ABC transport system permease protein